MKLDGTTHDGATGDVARRDDGRSCSKGRQDGQRSSMGSWMMGRRTASTELDETTDDRARVAREKIETITFDEKNNTVTISGFFDPQKLKKKLLCKACKVIKDIKIKEEEKPKEKEKPKEQEKPKEKPKEQEKPKEKEKPKEQEKPKEKEKPKEQEKPKEKEKPKEQEKPKEKEKPKEQEKPKEKEKPNPDPVQQYQPFWPVYPAFPTCCWRPCYEQYYGGCRCSSCGMPIGWTAPPPPPAGGYMTVPSSSTCQFFCEEDPSSCTIM
ncbi:hypothetical protein MA16_Dca020769 [Dendrobium catenatum]|uniref:HMA domain-containing protein n=1 Tax=Dendrobium catenatum TaxID=906689 RepID=A0A2I0WDP2_9ASPA|nr:hypothetical protein MA16_Dca020769 [Dendrobium catenatum]